ncbi:hypothetical protein BDL97_03G139400 [Sphagnum fallax]|nr:hypothetical protein BDL97_03G139400 [Sphagnum fallax]
MAIADIMVILAAGSFLIAAVGLCMNITKERRERGNGGELRWRPSRGAPRKSRTLTHTCCKEANNLTESGFLKVFCYFFWGDKATRKRPIFET